MSFAYSVMPISSLTHLDLYYSCNRLMRSSADRASPWMSYTHIPLLGLLSLFDVTCSSTSFQKWSMSPIALHIAFIRMWYTFVVGLPGRTCVSCWLLETSSWSLHLSFGLMHLIAAKSFLFQLYGCHLRNPSLEISMDYTCVHLSLILLQGCSKIQLYHVHSSSLTDVTSPSVGSGDVYLPHMIVIVTSPLDLLYL